jgi:hypothetical protein
MTALIIAAIVLVGIIILSYAITKGPHDHVYAPTVQEETPSPLKGGESIYYASDVVIPVRTPSADPTLEIQSRGRVHRTNSVEPTIHYVHDTRISDDTDSGDFATSMLVAELTDSALLGAAVGGDIVGAMIGEEIAESNRETTDDSDGVYQSHAYEDDQQDNSYTPDTRDDSYTRDDSDSSSSSYSSGSDD